MSLRQTSWIEDKIRVPLHKFFYINFIRLVEIIMHYISPVNIGFTFRQTMITVSSRFVFALVVVCSLTSTIFAQIRDRIEPPELPPARAKTAFQEGLRTGALIRFGVTDNGMGVGGEYRKITNRFTELVLSAEIGSVRDSREQLFNSYYFGQIAPNKYKRVMSVPIMIGWRQRMFADTFDDNFRLNIVGMAGSSFAMIYPYFDDINENGIHDQNEIYYDIFRGLDQMETKLGTSGKIAVGIDFGEKFKRISTFEFGYHFQYFSGGIQVMQPNAYEIKMNTSGGYELAIGPGLSKQSFFGTPVISLSFGRFW